MSEAQLPFTLRDAYLREGGEKCAELRKYLNKKTRVHISDGRVFTGYLSAVDNKMGLILMQATEYINFEEEGKEFHRSAGCVMISGQYIVKCETLE